MVQLGEREQLILVWWTLSSPSFLQAKWGFYGLPMNFKGPCEGSGAVSHYTDHAYVLPLATASRERYICAEWSVSLDP